jgi:hypothetical protein
MKKQLLIVPAILLFLCKSGLAQKNIFIDFQYEPGYVVTNKGDTLRGLIKYARQYELSLRVYFHDEKTREPQVLHPFTIRSYFVHNETYESKIYDYAPERPDGFAVFMRRMNLGACRVYEYWNSDQERGFTQVFLEKSGKPMEEVQFFGFKDQMVRYFSDFPQLSAKIARVLFRRRDLPKIVEEYNTWKARNW